ncbi:LPS assembly lipoprotein LptE [Poseidonocella sedimentorum]|uniref:LPS-assembly lipoprotein n=1 Tax=Poseidonocella sedimentorum TaxID=871652 RepID=A0A1I6ERK9_9RHOB|nr:LPS assembly lipoprotein LptE [Poseidonocella sedimentorum]SFR20148.1 LPS-assembly lipoprotein [Poseidonocella sedimentorum]
MRWSGRRSFLIGLAAAGLAGCGLRPVYAPSGAGALAGRVAVTVPENRESFLLVTRLRDRLGAPASAPDYRLDFDVSTRASGLAVTQEQSTTRYQIIGTVRYALRDTATGAESASGTVTGFTGYSTTGSTVATLAAERDARERLMTLLADDLTAQLLAQVGA